MMALAVIEQFVELLDPDPRQAPSQFGGYLLRAVSELGERRGLLNSLTTNGVRTGRWLRVKDRLSHPPDATLYMPGHPAVVLRQRGPRELAEIPRSEIRSLIDQLGLATTTSE